MQEALFAVAASSIICYNNKSTQSDPGNEYVNLSCFHY